MRFRTINDGHVGYVVHEDACTLVSQVCTEPGIETEIEGTVFIPRFQLRMKFRLQHQCSTIQAETSAIKRA